MGDRAALTAERLRELFNYDPDSGLFTRILKVRGRMIGEVADTVNGAGYINICVDWKTYLAHRLAWLYMTGQWPEKKIDHRNGIRSDNRWSNLRAATSSQNSANSRTPRDSGSGLKGAYYIAVLGQWRAAIVYQQEYIHLGYFASKEEAHAAYCCAANKFQKEFARTA